MRVQLSPSTRSRIVICTHGFPKKSRRTPRQLLSAARERRKAYKDARLAGDRVRIIISETQEQPRRMP